MLNAAKVLGSMHVPEMSQYNCFKSWNITYVWLKGTKDIGIKQTVDADSVLHLSLKNCIGA